MYYYMYIYNTQTHTHTHTHTHTQKESILGVFDLGFKERGFNVDMEQLRLLLNHPDNRFWVWV
jgi:hypothetical protein